MRGDRRFVFPDAAPLHLSTVIAALERAGLVTEHVEGFAEDRQRRSDRGTDRRPRGPPASPDRERLGRRPTCSRDDRRTPSVALDAPVLLVSAEEEVCVSRRQSTLALVPLRNAQKQQSGVHPRSPAGLDDQRQPGALCPRLLLGNYGAEAVYRAVQRDQARKQPLS
jgi:hypothetical protein